MEWTERVRSIVQSLKESGKGDKEIEEIVMQAADKATATRKRSVSE